MLPEPQFNRLWLNQWSSGSGDALDTTLVDSAVRAKGPMNGTEFGFEFVASLDLGIKRDRSAFVVIGKNVGHTERIEPEQVEDKEKKKRPKIDDALIDLGLVQRPTDDDPAVEHRHIEGTQRLQLAHCQSWKPPKGGEVNIDSIEKAVLSAHKRFNFRTLLFDPSQASYLAQRLKRQGVNMIEVPFVASQKSAMACELLEQLNSRNVDLYRHAELISDLKKLQITEVAAGYKLSAKRDRTGHADCAFAFCLALLGAKRFTMTFQRPGVAHLPLMEAALTGDVDVSPGLVAGDCVGSTFDVDNPFDSGGGSNSLAPPAFLDSFNFGGQCGSR